MGRITTLVKPRIMSSLSALDRLVPPPPPPPGAATSAIRVPLFIIGCSVLAVRALCAALDAVPWPLLSLRLVAEVVCSVFGIDLVSGIYHATFDYADPGPYLRHVAVESKEAVHATRATDRRYHISGVWMQLVWNFQVHHFAPFPEHDHQLTETACVATPLLLLTLVQFSLGWLGDGACRVWVMLLVLAHGVQTSHFLAHQRVHRGKPSLPPGVAVLQDMGILLHPRVHRRHHETFDCNVTTIPAIRSPPPCHARTYPA